MGFLAVVLSVRLGPVQDVQVMVVPSAGSTAQASHLIGQRGAGFRMIMANFNHERLVVASFYLPLLFFFFF